MQKWTGGVAAWLAGEIRIIASFQVFSLRTGRVGEARTDAWTDVGGASCLS